MHSLSSSSPPSGCACAAVFRFDLLNPARRSSLSFLPGLLNGPALLLRLGFSLDRTDSLRVARVFRFDVCSPSSVLDESPCVVIVFWLPPRPASFLKELSLLESLCEKFLGAAGEDDSSFRSSSPIPRSTSSTDLARRRFGLSTSFSSTRGSSTSAERARLVESGPRDDRLALRLSFLRKAGALATLPPLDRFDFSFSPRKPSKPPPSEFFFRPRVLDDRLSGEDVLCGEDNGLLLGDDGSAFFFSGPTELDRLLSLWGPGDDDLFFIGPGLAVLRFIDEDEGGCFSGPGLFNLLDLLLLSPLILRLGLSRLEVTGIEATVRESPRLFAGFESFIFPNKSPNFPSSSPGFTTRSYDLPVCSLAESSSDALGFLFFTGIELIFLGGCFVGRMASSFSKGFVHLSAAEKIALFRSAFDCLEFTDFFRSIEILFIRSLVASSSRMETSPS
jgi:hypothetical protein